jgi:hypothetical protein
MVTSFSSKSELALNLSTDGRYVTFMGYKAAAPRPRPRPRPACRSGCSTGPPRPGTWRTRCRVASTSGNPTRCAATRPGSTADRAGPGCPGRRPPTACATSPGG